MRYLIFLAALTATASYGAEFLGHTPTGQWLFDYHGVKMICARSGESEVLCLSESDQWLQCEYRDPEQGYFVDCRPTEDPRSTPA